MRVCCVPATIGIFVNHRLDHADDVIVVDDRSVEMAIAMAAVDIGKNRETGQRNPRRRPNLR
jgi:hypothetical protein